MSDIAIRLTCTDVAYDVCKNCYFATIKLDGEYFHTVEVERWIVELHHPRLHLMQTRQVMACVMLVAEHIIVSQWEVECAPTLHMEQKYRRTITSSCGNLKVTESPYLMVT